MNRDQILKIIAEHREKLAAQFGVKSLALFGSVVRNEATAASDVDLLVEFDGRPVGLFHLSRTQHYLESILGVSKVDLVLRDGINPALKERILREAIYAGWERRTTALKPEYISKIALVLNVSVEYLLGHENGGQRKGGPIGKARRVFEEVSKLPRHKQQRILGIVEDFIAAQYVQK